METGSLFDAVDDGGRVARMKIVKADSLRVETVADALSLFDGFASMKAVTWSYGIGMVVRQMRKFKDVELVFGCRMMLDKQVKLSSLSPLIVQAEALRSLQSKWGREISERMERGECRLYFETTVPSHEKIYLLADEERGLYRTIIGSANFSRRAWSGDGQKEVIQICDGEESYRQVLEKLYLPFRETCSTKVSDLGASLDHLDERGAVGMEDVPMLRDASGMILLEAAEGDDEPEVVVSMSNCALLGGMDGAQAKSFESWVHRKSGKVMIDGASLERLKVEGAKALAERDARGKECPRLEIDWDGARVAANGREISAEGFEEDARCLAEFIESLRMFSGDAAAYQADTWKLAVWYFASPFFSRLRKACIQAQQEGMLISLPMCAILYGDANAGKTSLLEFLGKMMLGQRVGRLDGGDFKGGAPSKTVRANTVRKPMVMQVNQKGVPVLYDDVIRSCMTEGSLRKLLTNPYVRTLDMEYDGYPAVVATSNHVPPMPQEFQKRALFFQASASLDQKQAMKSGNTPSSLTERVHARFFAEYVRRMVPQLRGYLEGQEIADLDVYALSSGAIIGILGEAGCKPTWSIPLCIDDYFGEPVMCQRAARSLKRCFTASRESFERDEEGNVLIVRSGAGNRSTETALKEIAMMLPPRFEAEYTPGMFTCKLREAEQMCGMRFAEKDSWWRRLWE